MVERSPGGILETARKPKETSGSAVLYLRWVVERTLAWMPRCRRLAKDRRRTPEISAARAQPAACRFLVWRFARG